MKRILLMFSILIVLVISCGQEELNSSRPAGRITIDGSSSEWEDALIYLPEENLAFALCNDDSFLYMCMVTSDRNLQMRIMAGGVTVWFDDKGGKAKAVGVRYPVGGPGRRDRGDRPPRQEMTKVRQEEFRQERMPMAASNLEILGRDDIVLERLPVENNENISAGFSMENENFVYELAMPIRNGGANYALAISPKNKIGVGFEITAAKMRGDRRPESGDFGGGHPPGGMEGRPGGGGSRGGRMGGGRMGGGRPGSGEGGMSSANPIRVWLKVNLAE